MTAAASSWLCTVCGYVHPGGEPPDCCPVCGAARDDFTVHAEVAAAAASVVPTAWRCLNCDYVHDGKNPPAVCPVCGAAADRFEPVTKSAAALSATPGATRTDRVVVIGGGIAGVAAAEAVATTAPQATVTLVCEESAPPYYRLNLTRYLADEIERADLPIHPVAWYGESRIALRTGTAVTHLDRERRLVELAADDTLPYDSLILTTGSHPFVPPLPGANLAGVFSLRTTADADAIRERLRHDPRCLVIGGGVLGIEAAGALGRQGAAVTLLESHAWLMPRQLNRQASAILEAHLSRQGVNIRKEVRTKEILGDDEVAGIMLENGEKLDATTILLATGIRPNTALARKAKLEVNRGIVVDNHLRTADPAIFAAGDVAEHNGILYGTWAPSQFQGRIAGLNAVGASLEFGGVPRANTLKLLGLDLTSIGRFEPEDGGDLPLAAATATTLAHFLFRDGRLVGAILIGHPQLAVAVKHAIEDGRSFAPLLRDTPTAAAVIAQLAAPARPQEDSSSINLSPSIKRSDAMSTANNLQDAFAGESQANRKYLAFAKKAEQDGFPQVAKLFRAAAEAETIHAHAHFRVMGGIKDTAANLADAIAGEGHEFHEMYPQFVAEAQAEGNQPAEISFRNALTVEGIHHGLYSEAFAAVKAGKDLPAATIFVCSVCGNTVVGQAPDKCPVCGVPKDKFTAVA